MQSHQILSELSGVMEALDCLKKALYILDISNLPIAAIHVDAAISCIHAASIPTQQIISNLDYNGLIDFSTMDKMVESMRFDQKFAL